jgi:outer membrane protein assembly factor BamB
MFRPVSFTAAALLAAALAAPALADWPRFMGASGTGVAPETEKIAKSFPAGGPKVLWEMPVAEGFASPAVVAGKVYILDRPGGGNTEKFSALDLATGKEEWSVDNESGPSKNNYGNTRGTPSVDGAMAYAIGNNGDLYAFDLAAHKIAWHKLITKDFGAKPGGWGFAMSPVVLGDLLLVDTPGSKDSGVVALNKKTGEKVWASETFGAQDTYTTPVVTTIEGVEQAISWHKGAVAGFDTKTGKTLWTFKWRTDRPVPNPVVLPDGKIFLTIGYGGHCTLLKLKKNGAAFDAQVVFQDERTGSKVSNAIFYNGFLYTNASDANQGLQCFDPDGNLKWNGKSKFGLGSMIIVDDTIVMMNGDNGTLTLIEAKPDAYKELSSAKVLKTDTVWAPIVVSDGKMLVRDKATLKCLDVSPK